MLDRPLHWRDPRCVFVESMGDLWHPGIPFEFVAAVFGVMAACPQHRFIILTKQARRMREWFEWVGVHAQKINRNEDFVVQDAAEDVLYDQFPTQLDTYRCYPWPLSNVALLVSAWDQASADKYVPDLLSCPAAVRGVSAEPLLGQIDLRAHIGRHCSRCGDKLDPYQTRCDDECASGATVHFVCGGAPSNGLDWIIVGGESGAKARSMQPAWALSLRDQCVSAGVPFFFKQWGNWAPTYDDFYSEDLDAWIKGERLVHHRTKAVGGRELDGRTWDEFPKAWT
jgi:protein gp37